MTRSRGSMVAVIVGVTLMQCISLAITNGQQPERGSSLANLKRIALAMHVYHGNHGSFPAHASYKDGKKMLSWRVHLLPSLGEGELYKQFRLDEAWDSPHNRKLIANMPAVYSAPDAELTKAGKTRFQVPVGEAHLFNGTPKGIRSADIKDGASKTIMLVETTTKAAVVWSRPEDLTIDHGAPSAWLIEKGENNFSVAFADGQTHLLSSTIEDDQLRAMFTYDESD